MRALLFASMLMASPAQAQVIPGSPIAYWDFTGTARTSTEKLTSLVNSGSVPTMTLQGSMTTADIDTNGAHIQKDDNANQLPEKYMQTGASAFLALGENGTVYVRFKPDTPSPMGSFRTLVIMNAHANFWMHYKYKLDDTTPQFLGQARGGGGSIGPTGGPDLATTAGSVWNFLGAFNLQQGGADTGENCLKTTQGVAATCETITEPIGVSIQEFWNHQFGYYNEMTHGGENTGADGYIQVIALFNTKLTDTQMNNFLAYVEGESPEASGHHPRLLRRLRVR
jgi:hypothetical protein